MDGVCCFEGGFLLLPLLVALIYGEIQVGAAYGIIAVLCLILGAVVVWRKPKTTTIVAKDGLVIVALCWIVLSVFGAVPFTISGEIPSYVDALDLKPFPALPPPVPVSSPMWRSCLMQGCSGEALPTG